MNLSFFSMLADSFVQGQISDINKGSTLIQGGKEGTEKEYNSFLSILENITNGNGVPISIRNNTFNPTLKSLSYNNNNFPEINPGINPSELVNKLYEEAFLCNNQLNLSNNLFKSSIQLNDQKLYTLSIKESDILKDLQLDNFLPIDNESGFTIQGIIYEPINKSIIIPLRISDNQEIVVEDDNVYNDLYLQMSIRDFFKINTGNDKENRPPIVILEEKPVISNNINHKYDNNIIPTITTKGNDLKYIINENVYKISDVKVDNEERAIIQIESSDNMEDKNKSFYFISDYKPDLIKNIFTKDESLFINTFIIPNKDSAEIENDDIIIQGIIGTSEGIERPKTKQVLNENVYTQFEAIGEQREKESIKPVRIDTNPIVDSENIAEVEDYISEENAVVLNNLKGSLFIDISYLIKSDDENIEIPVMNSGEKDYSFVIPKDFLNIIIDNKAEPPKDKTLKIPITVNINENKNINFDTNSIPDINNEISVKIPISINYEENDLNNLIKENENAAPIQTDNSYDSNSSNATALKDKTIISTADDDAFVLSCFLNVDVSEVEKIDDSILRLPFKIIQPEINKPFDNQPALNTEYKNIQQSSEDLVETVHPVIEDIGTNEFIQVEDSSKESIIKSHNAFIKISKENKPVLFIINNENDNTNVKNIEIDSINISLNEVSVKEDYTMVFPIKQTSDNNDVKYYNVLVNNDTKISIYPDDLKLVENDIKNTVDELKVKIPVHYENNQESNNESVKVIVEVDKDDALKLINYQNNLKGTVGTGKKVNNIKPENIEKQINVKLIITIENKDIQVTDVSKGITDASKGISIKGPIPQIEEAVAADKNPITSNGNAVNVKNKEIDLMAEGSNNSLIDRTEKGEVDTKSAKDTIHIHKELVKSSEETKVKENIKIPVELSRNVNGDNQATGKEDIINAKLVIPKNVRNINNEQTSAQKPVDKESESYIPMQRINSFQKAPENFNFSGELFDKDNKNSEYKEIIFDKSGAVKGLRFGDTLQEISNNTENNTTYSKEIIENNIEKIVQNARMILRGGKGEIRMELEPKELGKMTMKITLEHSKLVAKIEVDTENAKNLFAENITQLKDSLRENGVYVQRIDLSVKDGQNNFTRYDFSENAESDKYNEKENEHNKYNEEDQKPSYSKRNMGYNTIELFA